VGFMDKVKDAAGQAAEQAKQAAQDRVDHAKQAAQQKVAGLNPFDSTGAAPTQQPGQAAVASEPLMHVKSHIEGKNADVRLWPDRIEWTKESFGGRRPASDTVLLKHVTNVTTQKDGLRFYAVHVMTSAGAVANTIAFRVGKDEASAFRDAVLAAVRDLDRPATVVVQGAPAAAEATVAEKVKQLADLHAAGILTDEEFAAAKASALGI
jgi:hypothetical protein